MKFWVVCAWEWMFSAFALAVHILDECFNYKSMMCMRNLMLCTVDFFHNFCFALKHQAFKKLWKNPLCFWNLSVFLWFHFFFLFLESERLQRPSIDHEWRQNFLRKILQCENCWIEQSYQKNMGSKSINLFWVWKVKVKCVAIMKTIRGVTTKTNREKTYQDHRAGWNILCNLDSFLYLYHVSKKMNKHLSKNQYHNESLKFYEYEFLFVPRHQKSQFEQSKIKCPPSL